MSGNRRSQAGIALLEVMIAMAILSMCGLSMVALVDSSLQARAQAQAREQEIVTASRVLAATTLLRAEELNQRLGVHNVGESRVSVSRPEKALYRLSICNSNAPQLELLVTVVNRP